MATVSGALVHFYHIFTDSQMANCEIHFFSSFSLCFPCYKGNTSEEERYGVFHICIYNAQKLYKRLKYIRFGYSFSTKMHLCLLSMIGPLPRCVLASDPMIPSDEVSPHWLVPSWAPTAECRASSRVVYFHIRTITDLRESVLSCCGKAYWYLSQ